MANGIDQIRRSTLNALQQDKSFVIWRATEIEPDALKKFATSEQGEQLSTEQLHKLVAYLFEGRAEYDGQTDTLLMKPKPTVAMGVMPPRPTEGEPYADPCTNAAAECVTLHTVRAVDATAWRDGAITGTERRIRA